jgi:DNA-binding response OmpR family regulator
MPLGPLDMSRVHVLVVDSNPHSRMITCTLLRGAGVTRIQVSESEADATDQLRLCDPHLAILEWEQTGVNGLLLTGRVRAGQISDNRALPIILLTSRASLQDVNAARMVGVNEYCIKPISAQVLMTRVNEVVHRPREFVDSPEYVGPCRRRKFVDEYAGPYRRLSDPTEEFLDDPLEEEKKLRMRARIDRLARAAADLTPGDRVKLRQVFTATNETRALSQDIGDALLARSAASLMRYLTGVGASAKLDPKIIDTHIDAMRQLLALPNAERLLRDKVALGLDKIVDKRLQNTRSVSF